MDTAAVHVATKDHSKYLKHAQRNMIATAVKIAQLCGRVLSLISQLKYQMLPDY